MRTLISQKTLPSRIPLRSLVARIVVTAVIGVATLPAAQAEDWPQWLGARRDGVWRETGILARFPKEGPKIRWRTPIGAGYSGPAVAHGRVYITDRVLADGAANPKNPFAKNVVAGKERILCLDEATGQVQWKHEYDCDYSISYPAGPRTTPIVADGRVYTLGAMGDLLCLDAISGRVVWSRNFVKDYGIEAPLWGFAAHPLLDGDKLICLVGAPGKLVVAFHKGDGHELWHALSAREPGYCPPMIYDLGGKRQLIIWNPESINGLDPETGTSYWSQRFTVKAGLSIPTPRQDGDRLFVTSFYNGSIMLRIGPEPTQVAVVWKGKSQSELPDRTDTLHSIIPTPVVKDGHIYGVCSYGELRCLKEDTGERVWMTRQPTTGGEAIRWANAFLIPQEDRFFLFNDQGDLIIARLTPEGYREISRAHVLEPTNRMANRPVIWSHPAFADRCMFARNDKEIICVSLAARKTDR